VQGSRELDRLALSRLISHRLMRRHAPQCRWRHQAAHVGLNRSDSCRSKRLCSIISGISNNRTCKWGIEWDICAPGLLCCVAFRTKLSPFGDDFPPKSLTHSRGDYLTATIRSARADRRPVNSTSTANPLRSSSVHAQIRTSTGLFVLISHENWCLGLP
jgi:hypothetical protein